MSEGEQKPDIPGYIEESYRFYQEYGLLYPNTKLIDLCNIDHYMKKPIPSNKNGNVKPLTRSTNVHHPNK